MRVKDYIHRLDNFDGPAVGEIAVGYEMFEEAFEIYKKFSLKSQAIKVLLDHMDDLPRALDYALKVGTAPPCLIPLSWSPHSCSMLPAARLPRASASLPLPPGLCRGLAWGWTGYTYPCADQPRPAPCTMAAPVVACSTGAIAHACPDRDPAAWDAQVDEPEVWSELGHAQLEAGAVDDAIASYLKSGDTSRYLDVIARSRDTGEHKVLVDFLLMVRKKVKDPKVSPPPCLARPGLACVGIGTVDPGHASFEPVLTSWQAWPVAHAVPAMPFRMVYEPWDHIKPAGHMLFVGHLRQAPSTPRSSTRRCRWTRSWCMPMPRPTTWPRWRSSSVGPTRPTWARYAAPPACRCIHCSMSRQLVCHLSSLVPHPRPGEQRTGLCASAAGRPSIREQHEALRIAPSAGCPYSAGRARAEQAVLGRWESPALRRACTRLHASSSPACPAGAAWPAPWCGCTSSRLLWTLRARPTPPKPGRRYGLARA